jgi:acetylornithine deacetylase/succinyl-diaminopimelate desuccinylase family protein
VNRPPALNLLRELIGVRTENPPGNEKPLALRLQSLLKKHLIKAMVDTVAPGRANLIARVDGAVRGPVLALNGHLDTVPVKDGWSHDPFAGTLLDGRLVGLGAADTKGALAAMMLAVIEAQKARSRMRGTLILAFVADEERTNLGTIDFLKRYKKPDYAVIGEPTRLDLVTSNRGTHRIRITTHGRAVHCSNPKAGTNAIYAMARVIARLEKYAESLNRGSGHYTKRPSLSVTLVKGGSAENVIPDSCQITLDRRLVYGESARSAETEIIRLLRNAKGKTDAYPFTWERIDSMVPWRVGDGSRLLEYCKSAHRKCFGGKTVLRDLGGTSEAGLFSEKGIDTIIIGPGDIAQAHNKNEYIEIDQVGKAVDFYNALIQEILFKD